MRKTIILSAMILGAGLTACREDGVGSIGQEYILFEDTRVYYAVLEDMESFTVPVISTVACNYDRTLAVEIIDEGSTAVEGRDYKLESNTVVIPAGEYKTDVVVYPQYDKFEYADTLSFNLKLVIPDQLRWDLYGDETTVSMYKVCPFDINQFSGWCVVSSLFLYNYPGVNSSSYYSYQRLIKTSVDETEENTVILHDWLYDGYDVKIVFDNSDPANPVVTMPEDQLISHEEYVFGQINGDNRILGTTSPSYVSYFETCETFVALWLRAYVYNISTFVGNVGDFYNLMEWVSDEEADRLRKEDGM